MCGPYALTSETRSGVIDHFRERENFHFTIKMLLNRVRPACKSCLSLSEVETQWISDLDSNILRTDNRYCLICCQRSRFFLWSHVFLMSSQANGFGKPNITLQDSQCKATSNTTHYILETPLSGCQTTKIPSHPSPVVLYINSVSTKAIIQSIISNVKSSLCMLCFVQCVPVFRVSWSVSSNTLYLFSVFPGPACVFSPSRDDSLPHWFSAIISSGNS